MPSNLETRALEALEWRLICDALASRTRSPIGGAVALRHVPFSTPAEARRLRQRVVEGRLLIEQSPVHGYVSGVNDVIDLLDRASRDGVLEPTAIFLCGHFMQTVGMLGEELRARKATAPNWAADFELAPKTPPVCERISRSVSSEGAVLDSASPELKRLREQRVVRRAEFEVRLEARVQDWHSRGLLQDRYYDQVDGRYVVPVRAELQSKVDGTLIGRSNTGQSVFIEPAELTASNNALKELELSIRAEEFRILRTLSNELGRLAPDFAPWLEVVGELDLALAAARLAKDWELTEPVVETSDDGFSELDLVKVFHPGLKVRQEAHIVRNSFGLRGAGECMLISGPNTGGKTVLLKAAALASCMARAGLLVPCDEGSRIPHHASVLAFIGDEQNLAAGLSSFSAQIMDMKAVLEDARRPMLIVIDEILSSTDPEEASALAQSLIEEFVARGHHVIVTSHFSELSLRLKTHEKVTVAAMEFDGGRPTYKLRLDELGASHALDVADRLGFPKALLKRARELVSTAKLDYEKAQAELKRKERELEEAAERARLATEREQEQFKRALQLMVTDFMARSEAALEETMTTLSERVSTYVRQGAASPRTLERLESVAKDAVRALEKQAVDVAQALGGHGPAPQEQLPLEAGAAVKIKSMKGSRGTVLEVRGEGAAAVATIQLGNFRLTRPAEDLEVMSTASQKRESGAQNRYFGLDLDAGPVSRKLDVRGRRYDEALAECERYVDQAFRSGAAQVTVVTGHGTGALKKGLKELLSKLPYIREYRAEREGDDGATLIEFER